MRTPRRRRRRYWISARPFNSLYRHSTAKFGLSMKGYLLIYTPSATISRVSPSPPRTEHVLHLPGRLLTGFDVKLRLFRYLRTLFRSWHSFGSSFPLFSSAYGLFLQNAGGGGGLVSVRDRI